MLSQLGASVADQNAAMLGQLLAKHGISAVSSAGLSAVPLYLAEVNAVILSGMLPYSLWMRPATESVTPPYRTDAGCFLVHEFPTSRIPLHRADTGAFLLADAPGLSSQSPAEWPRALFLGARRREPLGAKRTSCFVPVVCNVVTTYNS